MPGRGSRRVAKRNGRARSDGTGVQPTGETVLAPERPGRGVPCAPAQLAQAAVTTSGRTVAGGRTKHTVVPSPGSDSIQILPP